jgi:hypothetical protein
VLAVLRGGDGDRCVRCGDQQAQRQNPVVLVLLGDRETDVIVELAELHQDERVGGGLRVDLVGDGLVVLVPFPWRGLGRARIRAVPPAWRYRRCGVLGALRGPLMSGLAE